MREPAPTAEDYYASSCGQCGQDFAFGTSQERNDWLREHDPNHYDFCSFFRQANAEGDVSTCEGCGKHDCEGARTRYCPAIFGCPNCGKVHGVATGCNPARPDWTRGLTRLT